MERQEIQKLLDEALADKEFVARLETITTAEEAQKAFAEKGIEMTVEEAQAIGDHLANGDELDEEALENVAGGAGVGFIVAVVVIVIVAGLTINRIRTLWGQIRG